MQTFYSVRASLIENFFSFQKNVNLSIISPRKIPILIKIFEKAAGDLSSMNQDYSKDPRHLVLLKGYSFNDRPPTPQTNTTPAVVAASATTPNQNASNASMQSPNNQPAQKETLTASNQNNLIRNNNSNDCLFFFFFFFPSYFLIIIFLWTNIFSKVLAIKRLMRILANRIR